jgi:holliday junction DNA helicase RuvB
LIYAIDSNPEGWINEDSLINLASGGSAAKRMINEVLDKLSDEVLVERRRVGGKGFFRRTGLGISTGRQLKSADDLSISGTFAVGEDGMTWKPERGNPKNFDELIGQSSAKNLILKNLKWSNRSGEMPMSMLLYGPSGSGKTLIAGLVSAYLGLPFISLSMADANSNELQTALELAEDGGVLFLDELQAAKKATKDSILVSLDPNKPKNFVAIAATTDPGDLSLPLRRRFPLEIPLVEYTVSEAEELVTQRAQGLDLRLEPGAAFMIARTARANPARITRLITEARMLVDDGEVLERKTFLGHLEDTGRDARGIDDTEIEMLTFLRDESTGPAGMSKFVDVLGLDMRYVREKLHMLRREGLVKNMGRTGHIISKKGKEYLETRCL